MLVLMMRFSRKARRIGAGNPQRSPKILSFSVFARYLRKSGDDRNLLKFANPIHSLPRMPRTGLYSVNAIAIQPIGI